jgi:hypothetical protein
MNGLRILRDFHQFLHIDAGTVRHIMIAFFNVCSTVPCGHAVAQWLRHYATSRKVAGSRPDEVNESFSIHLILPAALGPGVYAASNIS